MLNLSGAFEQQDFHVRSPIIWVIGATRSSKSNVAKGITEDGRTALHFPPAISTSDYFRGRYGQEDTYSREFVFNLSAFSASCLQDDPDCQVQNLSALIEAMDRICVIEGERNPYEFSKLYNPCKDMVIFLHNKVQDTYETAIEPGIACIEQMVRWAVDVGTAPQDSVIKYIFGDDKLVIKSFDAQKGYFPAEEKIEGVLPRSQDKRYPWMDGILTHVQSYIASYYKIDIDCNAEVEFLATCAPVIKILE